MQDFADKLSSVEHSGIKAATIQTGNSVFPEAIVFQHEHPPRADNSPTVRVYRGIDSLDPDQIFGQQCYALRGRNEQRQVITHPELLPQVETLATEPTYLNLVAYCEAAKQVSSPSGRSFLDQKLWTVENIVLRGHSLRHALLSEQVAHPGSIADQLSLEPHMSQLPGVPPKR